MLCSKRVYVTSIYYVKLMYIYIMFKTRYINDMSKSCSLVIKNETKFFKTMRTFLFNFYRLKSKFVIFLMTKALFNF